MAITFEREQQATIQAYHRNRHDPRIKDLGVDTVLDMVRIFRIRKYWFYRYLSWARYSWSWASNFFYPEHHLGWYARIWNFCGATRPTSRLVKITSQKNLRIFMQLGCCGIRGQPPKTIQRRFLVIMKLFKHKNGHYGSRKIKVLSLRVDGISDGKSMVSKLSSTASRSRSITYGTRNNTLSTW